MIKLEITAAVAIYISVSIFLVIILWIFYNYNNAEKEPLNDAVHLEQCRYCAHVFFNYVNKDIVTCPLCRSYIQTESSALADKEKNRKNVKTAG